MDVLGLRSKCSSSKLFPSFARVSRLLESCFHSRHLLFRVPQTRYDECRAGLPRASPGRAPLGVPC